ncbi:MAG TPA: penicillin-binding transpeptidase domain-containing protein, partial [Ktedonobacteraceae bacterium]|nr:penicillin-binding transpeptidase domain-containing protein [Ktedonobacteraceae bacterium]
ASQEEQRSNFFSASTTLQDQAPHFDEYVLTQLEQQFHMTRSQLSRSGMVVTTTLNVGLQKQILAVMQQHIAEIGAAHHVSNAAEVLIDFHTGAIISMLGSIDYYDNAIDGQFNVALAYRQPGSSFKPYVYAAAFAQGASPAQAVDDAPTTFTIPGGTPSTYSPKNDDSLNHGHMTLRCALQNSLNVPAVRVLQHVGISSALSVAQAMGIANYEGTPGLSLVLGGLDVRLLDHTSAFGVFANNGVREPDYSISKVVQSTTGQVLFQHQLTGGTQVISPQIAYMMTSVLSDNTSRTPAFSACSSLQLYSNSQQACLSGDRGVVRPAAAKTGTTQDLRDGWAMGYTTDYVMGVWTGNDDDSPMLATSAELSAAPIWHNAMLLAEQGLPIHTFQNPGGLVRASVTYPDGVKSTDWFLAGSVPPSVPTPPSQSRHAAIPAPYCSTYSLAFPPPAGKGIPANGAWW